MAELFKYLAARYPDTLTRIITRTLDEAGQPHAYASTHWIAQLLDQGEVSPDEVLDCYNGAQPDVPVAGLAKLLAPRGTDPAHIGSLRLYGQYSGNLSSWYQSTIDAFTGMLQDDDPSVKAVATA